MKKISPIFIIFLSFFLALYFYSRMPEPMASHWGINGQADGYSSKNFGLFFMPILSVGLYLLFRFLPSTDPYRRNFKQFENHFNNFIIIIFIFLFYLYCLTIFWNLGNQFNMNQVLSPAFAGLFYYTGVLTSVAKRNWFVGIRTPWTLSSEKVWDKTHALGGKLFKVASLSCLLGLILPDLAIYLMLIPILSTTLFVFIYSYYLYRQENHET